MTFDYIPGVKALSPSLLSPKKALAGKCLELVVVGREHLNSQVLTEEHYDIELADVQDGASMTDVICVAMESVALNADIPADMVELIEIRIKEN